MSGLTCSREPSSKHSEGHHSALGPLEGSGVELEGSSIAWTQPVSTRRRNWNRGQSGTAGDEAMGVEHHCQIIVCILFHLLPPVAQRPNLGPYLRWASAGWSSGLWRKHSYPANTHVTQIDIRNVGWYHLWSVSASTGVPATAFFLMATWDWLQNMNQPLQPDYSLDLDLQKGDLFV